MAAELAERMQCALMRRGPDGGRMHHDAETLLVHRRLSILDLSEAGSQPLWNEDGTVCVIVNGEIYNFRELRRALERRGHRFRSHSDSEVLVHLYEDGGIDECCRAAEGMFAFGLWDARRRDLFLARDRLGIKPLVVSEHGEGVTFASTLSGLLADGAVPRELRPAALTAVLKWGFVPSPWSAIRAARRVGPGTWLRVRSGRIVQEQRWWIDAPPDDDTTDEEVRQAIDSAVRSHLVADVPVGALLSAGIDSGIVTALAARHAGRDGIEAWTVSHRGFEQDEFDDASRAGAHFGVHVHEIPVGAAGLMDDGFDAVVRGLDEPLADASLVGLHRLYAAIAPHRRVVLSGDGGDELFAGYDWHLGLPAPPPWARGTLFRTLAPGVSLLARGRGKVGAVGRVAAHVRRAPASVYLDKLRIATDDELRAAGVEPGFDDSIEGAAAAAWERFEARGVTEQMLAVDRATRLVDQMLAKLDAASMAYSVEARVPLLADAVVRASKGLAPERKRRADVGKICLRDWYAMLGPSGLADRRKTGFDSPIGAWLSSAAGQSLRHWAREGFGLLGARESPSSPRFTFAAAVLAAWVGHHVCPAPSRQ